MFLSINPAVLDRIIGLLTPLFLCSSENDVLTARHAADRLLGTYNVQTEEELRLAAEIIAFGFGALDALSQSMAPGLTVSAILRLRGSATAQHRSANQCQRTLEKLRKERRIVAAELASKRLTPEIQREEDPVTAEPVRSTDDTQTPKQVTRNVGLSRQQQRAAERKSAKIQRKHDERARRQAKCPTRTPPLRSAITQPQSIEQSLAA